MSEINENIEIRMPPRVFDKIEKMVVDIYDQLFITNVPINPDAVAKALGFIAIPFSELSTDARTSLRERSLDGLSYLDPSINSYVICYDDSMPQTRVRFTIMHEVGHIILGHKEESILAKRMADYFAAYFLAPSPLIEHLKCEDYMDISHRFEISQESADYCFRRFYKWLYNGENLKEYEERLLGLFN